MKATLPGVGNVMLLLGSPDYKLTVGKKVYVFGCDSMGAPALLGRDGEPLEKQPGERSPFWRAVSLWAQQGRRLGPGGIAIWDEPPPLVMRRISGRHMSYVSGDLPDNGIRGQVIVLEADENGVPMRGTRRQNTRAG